MPVYTVTVRASGHQIWSVQAQSKAEAVRKIKAERSGERIYGWWNLHDDVEPIQGDLDKMHWSTAEVDKED